MHQLLDEVSNFAILCRFLLELEKVLGGTFYEDKDLEGVHSLADLTALVEKKIEAPSSPDRHATAVDAVRAAAVTIFPSAGRPSFDARLIDVFRPHLSEFWLFSKRECEFRTVRPPDRD
jgi:hypothetical protein